MQASHIREGQWYAVCEQPRKGVKPENLHKLDLTHKRYVLRKGVDRFAEHAQYDNYKSDGIEVTSEDGRTRVIKPRDVLMPWKEYEQRTEQDAAEAAASQAERDRLTKEAEEASRAVTERLVGMGLVAYVDWQNENDFHIYGNRQVRMSIPAMNKLLDSVSERVYELLASAE